jgi:cyclopropane fatty-acyl-phospholipid synthase-like methyltransferase
MSAKQHAPAAARNREPIREVLANVLPAGGLVLEIASGSGEHAVHFAAAFPHLTWQPSDAAPEALASITAHAADAGLANLAAPLALDAAALTWPIAHADAIVCINMVHISPWEATIGLFRGAARVLATAAPLVLYGPYRFSGRSTAASNEAFDASLRARDPRWGVRDVDDLARLAGDHGFALAPAIPLPANNHVLVFAKIG